MASTPKGPQKMKVDWNLDRQIYDDFVRSCSRKGLAPHVVVEKLMSKFAQTGQM